MWPFLKVNSRFKRFLYSFIKKDQIYIFFTLRSLYFISFLIALIFLSMTFGNSLVYSSTFLFFSFLMVSSVKTNYNLYKVSIEMVKQRGFFPEEDPCLEVLIQNKSKKPKFDLFANFEQFKTNPFSLKPFSSSIVTIQIKNKPGIYQLDKLNLRTNFPFELMHSWKVFQFKEKSLVIFPKRKNHLPHITPLEGKDSSFENKSLYQKGGGEDFHSHLNYSEGDSFRFIDWKIYAREKGTLIKTYEVNKKDALCIEEHHLSELNERELGLEKKDEQISFWLTLALRENREFSINLNGLNLNKGKTNKDLESFLFQYLKWRGL